MTLEKKNRMKDPVHWECSSTGTGIYTCNKTEYQVSWHLCVLHALCMGYVRHYFFDNSLVHSLEYGWVTKAGVHCHGNHAGTPLPFHHLLWSHHPLHQDNSQYTMSCTTLPHPLWVRTTTSTIPHLQHHVATLARRPCPPCELYSWECHWLWDTILFTCSN